MKVRIIVNRLIAAFAAILFAMFSLNRFVAIKILEQYHPEKVPEYWYLYPVVLFVIAAYFAVCVIKARFMLWKRNKNEVKQ